MARGNRDLAGFGDVATVNPNKNNNTDVNVDANNNVNKDNVVIYNDIDDNGSIDTGDNISVYYNEDINEHVKDNNNTNDDVNINDNEDFFDQLTKVPKKKEEKSELRGFYIDKDLLAVIDRLSRRGERGLKSKIVNEALRKVFNEKGLL